MEALLEREADMENWNDDRLDELSRRMDKGFEETREEMRSGFKEMREGLGRLSREMKEGFAQADQKMDERFLQTNERIDGTNSRIDRLLQALFMGALGALVTLGAALLGAAAL